MSTISSASTDAEVWDAFDDNASFDEDASVAKAKAFITACRVLLRRRPTSMTVDGNSVAFDSAFVHAELERARKYVNTSGTGGAPRYLRTDSIRD